MPALILAILLVIILMGSGFGAIAYLFPQIPTQDSVESKKD